MSKPENKNESLLNDVSDTALWVAHYRALEDERKDALYHDPFAKRLVGERGRKIAESMGATARYTSWTLAIRTVIIDDFIQQLLTDRVADRPADPLAGRDDESPIDAVVNLGAGLDARPYRMKLPKDLLWVEVDYPHMIEHKEAVLASDKPICRLERVKLDLADRTKRKELFLSLGARAKNIFVITEGVIPYLTEQQVTELGIDLHEVPSFKYWTAEYLAPITYQFLQNSKERKRMKNAPFQFMPKDWYGVFKIGGWSPLETKYMPVESIRLKRKMPAPWFAKLITPFLSKKRKEAFMQMSGFILFGRD